ncbi:MAG: response regulator [Desulfarculus sp.]|nr:response regulator [Desulfarculus sp.]
MAWAENMARVVLVDDEAVLADLFAKYLSRYFQVRDFCSPHEAKAFLERNPADLLISDLIMPGINGLELARLARQLQPGLKVVLISGTCPWTWQQSPPPGQFDAFLNKPLRLADLHGCCKRVLDQT